MSLAFLYLNDVRSDADEMHVRMYVIKPVGSVQILGVGVSIKLSNVLSIGGAISTWFTVQGEAGKTDHLCRSSKSFVSVCISKRIDLFTKLNIKNLLVPFDTNRYMVTPPLLPCCPAAWSGLFNPLDKWWRITILYSVGCCSNWCFLTIYSPIEIFKAWYGEGRRRKSNQMNIRRLILLVCFVTRYEVIGYNN